jgi:branched-chain amino acid transport system ATP-binding protein
MALLEVRELRVTFGGAHAVDGISIDVDTSQLVGLIGPNGAGKTTTVDAITGFVPSSGSVIFKGTQLQGRRILAPPNQPGPSQPPSGTAAPAPATPEVTPERLGHFTSLPPTRRAHLGLSRTWQGADLFVDLSVLDNLRVAGEHANVDEHMAILESLGIAAFAHGSVQSLSHGQRKLVGVARALAAKPALVCMDEPAAGLDTVESQFLGQRIRSIADAGTSVLLIDHDMGLVLGICDYVVVLDFGKVIAEGPPSAIRSDPRVLDAYLGKRHKAGDADDDLPVANLHVDGAGTTTP